ncbi:MAG: CPBP family intramembrane metalloprotease [Bowdeniella nasicola]|nr:CPBP family intramembrane metalloprotease [Bowdeniella nasicola]
MAGKQRADRGGGAIRPATPTRLDSAWMVPLVVYLVIAFGGAWLIAVPLYTSGQGLAHPAFMPISLGIMMTPALAAFVTGALVQRWPLAAGQHGPGLFARLGLPIRRPYRPLLGWFLLSWFGMIALVVIALITSALCGVYRVDLTNFTGLQSILVEQAVAAGQGANVGELTASVREIAFAQVVVVIFASLLNVLPALGEEIGWRGWLMPHLAPLGVLPTIVFSGVIWGVWHLPLLALGYNYPGHSTPVALGAMIGMCTLVGALLYWVRLRSRSVWPAAVGHGALNASASLMYVFGAAPVLVDTTMGTILGVCGWFVPLALVVLIAWRGGFTPAPTM